MQLRILKGHDEGKLLELDKPVFAVGREPDNDFVVPDPQISRYHCIFQEKAGKWSIKDLQSRNGVCVNGKKIMDEQALEPGDEVTLYNLVFKLQDPALEPLPLSPFDTKAKDEPQLEQTPLDHNPFDNLTPSNEKLFDPEDPQENQLPNPLQLIIPIVKILFFIAILGAIAILIYMLTTEPENTTKQQEQKQEQAQEQQEQKPEQDSQEQQDKHGETAQAGNSAPNIPAELPPPPPETKTESIAEKDKTQPQTPKQEQPNRKNAKTLDIPRFLVVKSLPEGAQVIIDGQQVGKTPAVIQNLKGEQLSLQLQLQGYETMTRRVDLKEGLPKEPLRLIQKTGTIWVNSEPQGAAVSEGRQFYGTTPLLIQEIAPGEHQFILERKGYETQKVNVVLTEAKGERIETSMVSNLGALEIITTPAKCQVFLDGLFVGTTKKAQQGIASQMLILKNLAPGRCTIKVLHPQTGTFDTVTTVIPKRMTARQRVFIWIPTHKVVKLDSKTVTGMLLAKDEDSVIIMDVDGKKHDILKQEYTDIIPITKEDQIFILKNKATARGPSGQLSSKSKLSILVTDFLQQADYAAFRGYVKQKLCITGKVTSRMKTAKETVIYFGKQEIRCQMAPAATDDYKKIGKLKEQGKDVSLRGIYEGTRNDVHVFSNCVLLPYPD